MAGSGRRRGCASFTFNIEAICFGKGSALPDVICKPPPPFPSTENKPVPLKTGEDEDYMLALKQDLRGTMKKMPYFLAVGDEHQDWRRLPREMKPKKANKKGAKTKKAKTSDPKSNLVVIKKTELNSLVVWRICCCCNVGLPCKGARKEDEEEESKDEKDETKDKEGEDDEAEDPEEYDEEHEVV